LVNDLESRVVLSAVLSASAPALALVTNAKQTTTSQAFSELSTKQQSVNGVVNSTAEVLPNGNVVVTTPTQYGNVNPSVLTYEHVIGGWKLIAWDRWQPNGALSVWTEDTWNPDGSLVETGWGGVGPGYPEYYSLDVTKSQIALTLYHEAGSEYLLYYGAHAENSDDATVNWAWTRAKDGGVSTLLSYSASEVGAISTATWNNQTLQYNANFYASGWYEYYPNYYSIPVPGPVLDPPSDFTPYVTAVGQWVQRGTGIAKELPGTTELHQTLDGHPADTIFNSPQTKSISFVYMGTDKKTLFEQIYGSTVNGKWVTVTTNNAAFISQTATFDKAGGALETSVTVRTEPDGRTVTLNGAWTSGTAVDNATGTETANNYLGFSSVTININDGKPVSRSGLLANGGYAVDTYNSAGTGVIERQVSNTKGSPVTQTWTDVGNHTLQISWNNPDPSTSSELTTYVRNLPHSNNPGYSLTDFQVQLVTPIRFVFNNGTAVMTTDYHWRFFLSYDRRHHEWISNYRESAAGSREHSAGSSPSGQLPFSSTPALDNFWNKA
jgi:hypothetical protein